MAIAFLTRLPVPGAAGFDGADVGRAAPLFPAAGALLGAILAAAGWLLAPRLPPLLTAALLLALAALLTGALHLDGLADTADGLGGGRTREDALRIMRDHAVGAYGASALVLTLLVEVAALSALAGRPGAAAWIVLAFTASRWSPVALSRFLPSARAGAGLGAATAAHVSTVALLVATAIAGVAAVPLRLPGLAALLAAFAFAAAFGALCRRRIGGVTGDTLGASAQLVEALVLVLGAAAVGSP
ncbi:MAG TPA: adenosylcobinamide-GDP ribazoletransferase [Anaeromyxobacteraceae bacterium]|nr:adenosylcobinamide-GDP ribazoletransferase [Anaeromyxobacteraceae bacterium]